MATTSNATGATTTGATTATGATSTTSSASTGTGGGAPPGPNPPAGDTACGSGTFTQADAHAACVNIGFSPKNCDAVTITGGKWQAWCDASMMKVYVWAEFDGALQTDGSGCIPEFAVGTELTSPGGAALAGQPHPAGTGMVSSNVSYEYQVVLGAPAPSGTGLFGGSVRIGTGQGGLCAFNDPNSEVVVGFNMTW